jgi:hypothetical protein
MDMNFPNKTEARLGILLLENAFFSKNDKKLFFENFIIGIITREEIMSKLDLTEAFISSTIKKFEDKKLLVQITNRNEDSRKKSFGITIKGYEFGKSCEQILRIFDLNFTFAHLTDELFKKDMSMKDKVKSSIKTDVNKMKEFDFR